MKILFAFWSPLYSPGFKSSRLEGYLDECDRQNISVSYVGLPTKATDSARHQCLQKYISSNKIKVISGVVARITKLLGLSSLGRHVGIYLLSKKIVKSKELQKVDVLFCQPYFYLLVKEARELGIPVILESDSAHPAQTWNVLRKREKTNNISRINADPWNYYPYVKNALHSISAADKIIVFSDHAEQTYLEAGINKAKVKKLRPPLTSNMQVSNRVSEHPKFVFAANHATRKGLDLVLAAWKQYTNEGGKGKLFICGDESPAFKKIWQNNKPLKQYTELGNINLREFFAEERCVLISPSFSEGRPRTVLEAMGAGCPVIASFESSADIVDNTNGWIVELNKESILHSLQAIESDWTNTVIHKGDMSKQLIMEENTTNNFYSDAVKLLISSRGEKL